jgi:hypothetical protein
MNAMGTMRATFTLTFYEDTLLVKAQELITNGDFGIAVMVAHLACEISADRAISQAFTKKRIKYLEKWVEDLRLGQNLANPRVLKLYNAVTGDQIQKPPNTFWPDFKESANLRNDVTHKGRIVTKAEAKKSHKAASDLVAYLNAR